MRMGSKADAGIAIKEANYKVLQIKLVGTAPYVSNNFSQEAADKMAADQAAGQSAKTGRQKKPPKDFEAAYRGSLHVSEDGWYGVPAMAFKAALVRACCVCGVEMTKAKMCVFVLADGYEVGSSNPLVRITKGKPERFDAPVRNSNGGCDIRARGRFASGWECTINVKFDADLLTPEHVANLVNRAGTSVGVGAGRPFSKESCGMGWGTFEIDAERVSVGDSNRRSKKNGAAKHAGLMS